MPSSFSFSSTSATISAVVPEALMEKLFPFFELPRELRDKIYKHALISENMVRIFGALETSYCWCTHVKGSKGKAHEGTIC